MVIFFTKVEKSAGWHEIHPSFAMYNLNNMIIHHYLDCQLFTAGDATGIREILHPGRISGVTNRFSLAHAELPAGKASLPHRLKSAETYYILEGRGRVWLDGIDSEVAAGFVVFIPPGTEQWIQNTGDSILRFLCMVDPPWTSQEEEILES